MNVSMSNFMSLIFQIQVYRSCLILHGVVVIRVLINLLFCSIYSFLHANIAFSAVAE